MKYLWIFAVLIFSQSSVAGYCPEVSDSDLRNLDLEGLENLSTAIARNRIEIMTGRVQISEADMQHCETQKERVDAQIEIKSGRVVQPGSPASLKPGKLISLNKRQLNAVHEGLRESLKDPDSAKFGGAIAAKIIDNDGQYHIAVCGLVNAKNGYGGYTGNRWFYGHLLPTKNKTEIFAPIRIAEDGSDTQIIAEYCTAEGMRIPD